MTRLSLEESKSFWFENDLTVYVTQVGGLIYALPKVEAERAWKYCVMLDECETYGEVQLVYDKYVNDSKKPRLVPRIRNVSDEIECLEHMWILEDSFGDRVYGILSNQELLDYWLPRKFDLWDKTKPGIYLDETETLTLMRDFQVWTDAWMPAEIVSAVGILDDGSGIDYVAAEYLYRDLDKFRNLFTAAGFALVLDHPAFLSLLDFV